MNSRPVVSPANHHVLMARGVPAGVSMNRTSDSGAGVGRMAGRAKNIAYGFWPSSLTTCTTFPPVSGSTTRNMYLPGGSATPGTSTGALNVKYVRLSSGCAATVDPVNHTIATTAAARQPMLFLDMLTLTSRARYRYGPFSKSTVVGANDYSRRISTN